MIGVTAYKYVNEALDIFLSIVFPLFCISCNKEGDWCCEDCKAVLSRQAVLSCPNCEKATPGGRTCERCINKTALSGLIAASSYADPVARNFIQAIKFNRAVSVLKYLNKFAVHGRAVAKSLLPEAIIVPVPLHKIRENMRGYNQAEIIADTLDLGEKLKALKRVKLTSAQTELNEDERKLNPIGAFSCIKNVEGMSVILVDDVFTTGATMEAAARALREAGAKEVWGFVVARG